MSSVLAWLFKKVILEFLWEKGRMLLDLLFKWLEEYRKRKEIVKENDKQAAIVEAIAEEIKALIKNGQPVPPELYEKLKIESEKLINNANNT